MTANRCLQCPFSRPGLRGVQNAPASAAAKRAGPFMELLFQISPGDEKPSVLSFVKASK